MAITILIICSIFYINQSRKKENEHEKRLMYAFASFWFSIALARTYFYFSDFFLEGTYTGDLSIIFQTFDIVNYIFLYLYLYIFIYIMLNVTFLIFFFIWFSIKAKKEFQLLSSMMTIGFATFLIGLVFETNLIKILNVIPPALPPILVIVGAILAVAPLIIKFEFFYNRLVNWIVLLLIGLILILLVLIIFANLALPIISLIIIGISAFLLALVIIYIIVNIVKRTKIRETSSKGKKEELKDFLAIFTKPTTITEEELNTYRENKICIVCKSKVSRLNYVCPKCEVLYCIRCSKALVNLKNMCWVCDTPIDILNHIPVLKVAELLKEGEEISNNKEIESN